VCGGIIDCTSILSAFKNRYQPDRCPPPRLRSALYRRLRL